MKPKYNIEELTKELDKVTEEIKDFGADYPYTVSMDKYESENPEIMKIVKGYLRFLDIYNNREELQLLWDAKELVDWEDDWPFILGYAGDIITKGTAKWQTMCVKYYKSFM